jgi:hypothetical protein
MAHIKHRYDRAIYEREDAAKKLTRFMWWQAARKYNPKVFYTKKHLVLAGHGGDIAMLLGMGVDPSHIIAVDSDPECVSYCKTNYPAVDCRYGLLRPYSRAEHTYQRPRILASLFLDFCGAPALQNRRILWDWADCVDPNGVVGCTFLTSRGSVELAHLGQEMAALHGIEDPVLIRAYCIANGATDWYPRIGYHYLSHQKNVTHGMLTLMFTRRPKKYPAHILHVKANEDDIKAAILATDERPDFDAAMMLNVPRMTVAGWKSNATKKQQAKE